MVTFFSRYICCIMLILDKEAKCDQLAVDFFFINKSFCEREY